MIESANAGFEKAGSSPHDSCDSPRKKSEFSELMRNRARRLELESEACCLSGVRDVYLSQSPGAPNQLFSSAGGTSWLHDPLVVKFKSWTPDINIMPIYLNHPTFV